MRKKNSKRKTNEEVRWPRLMSIETVSAYLELPKTKIKELDIPTKKFGKHVRWDKNDIDSFVSSIENSAENEWTVAIERNRNKL